MRIEFILTSTMEVSHFAPVVTALREFGQNAVFTIPGPLFEETPFGFSDLDEIKAAVARIEPKLPCQRIDLDADAFVTTHPADAMYHRNCRGKTFRMMYGMGLVDPHSDREMGKPSDFYLVHGPLGQRIQFTAHGLPSPLLPPERVKVVGYPRLDGWWKLDKSYRRGKWDDGDPNLLWLPTWSVRSSIDDYIDTIDALQEKFQVWVKPHHCTERWESQRIERLARFRMLKPDTAHMNVLAAADLILADLSSGAFTEALFIGKPVVGLSNPDELLHNMIRPASGAVVCCDLENLAGSIEFALAHVDWRADPLLTGLRADLITSTKGNDGMVAAKAILECLR